MIGSGNMTTSSSASNDWFGTRRVSTGASFGLSKAANVLAATIAVSVGTGVFVDHFDWWRHNRLGDSHFHPAISAYSEIGENRSAAENIERVREVLSPNISSLAKIFGVSRQAVYNWLNGEQPKEKHLAMLRDLAQAADMLVEAGIRVNGALLKRQIIAGKSLFEVARDGGSTFDAAQQLVRVVKREAIQREQMAGRFAGRKAAAGSVESHLPAENDVS